MNQEELSQEQAEDMEAEYLAEGIEALEKESGLELGEEALDDVIARARANRGENQEPLVADAFGEVVSEAEAQGAIDYEEEALEQFEEQPADESVSAEQLMAMQRGDYGPQVQREALEAAGIGMEPEGEYRNSWADEFVAQESQLEAKLGRELTTPERQALEADAAQTDKPLDLLGAYDRVVGRDTRNPDDAHQIMAETFEEEQEKGSDSEDTEPEEWQEPKELDMSDDGDRQAAMLAEMEEAA